MADLNETARALVAPGKGILAADESTGTITKRFDSIGVESTEENRRAYRDMLFTTEGAAEHISGVILYDETIRQSTADGTPFPKYLEQQGVIPGIKVDLGAKALAGAPGRDGHRGARRPARAPERVPRARRQIREVARRDHDRRRDPERVLPVDERARARTLWSTLPRGRHRADHRARGAHGRRPHHRAELRRDLAHTARGLHRAARPAGLVRGDAPEAEHGALGLRVLRAGERPADCRAHSQVLPAPRPGRCTRESSSSPAVRATRTRRRG